MLPSTTIIPNLVIIVNRSVDIWTKLLKKTLLTGDQKPASSLKMDLDGELVVVERNYRKTLFALRMNTHTKCMERINTLNALLNHYEYIIIH